MNEEHNEPTGISLSPSQLAGLLIAVAAGGGGVYGFVGPQLEKSALQACYDNSSTALSVAAQHGEEFVTVREDIARLRNEMYERTKYRWTQEDQANFEREHLKREQTQDRRLDLLERQIGE